MMNELVVFKLFYHCENCGRNIDLLLFIIEILQLEFFVGFGTYIVLNFSYIIISIYSKSFGFFRFSVSENIEKPTVGVLEIELALLLCFYFAAACRYFSCAILVKS